MLWLLLILLGIGEANATSLGTEHYQTGLTYERLGRYNKAYTELQLATNLDADDPRSFVALGVVAVRLGNNDEAIRAFERSITLDANACASYYELAFLYEKKSDVEHAVGAWNRFLALSQNDVLKAQARKHLAYLQSIP